MNEINAETIINAPAWQFPRRHEVQIVSDDENCPVCGFGMHYYTGIKVRVGGALLKAHQCTSVICGQGFLVR